MSDVCDEFGPCEICGSRNWSTVYDGAVRDGTFGNVRENAKVARCSGCDVFRLSERYCLGENEYEGDDYRIHLGQGMDLAGHYASHDHLQLHALNVIPPHRLRGLTVADVGAGGGSFLDHVRGIVGSAIAIEPTEKFRSALAERGYDTYAYAMGAVEALGPVADVAVSFQVIEHVSNPREFLTHIHALLKPGGRLVISTPNRADILMDILPELFSAFFYRVVHRWYFNAASLARCAAEAGFAVEETRHLHRYGMANAMLWLRDKSPKGNAQLGGIDKLADDLWKSYLEASGRSDTLFMTLTRD